MACYSLFGRSGCSLIWGILTNEGDKPVLHVNKAIISTSFACLSNPFFAWFNNLQSEIIKQTSVSKGMKNTG